MTTISIDEQTHSKLETKARACGVGLPAFLRMVADTELVPTSEKPFDQNTEEEFRRAMGELIAEASDLIPQPTKLIGTAGQFADALADKHRR